MKKCFKCGEEKPLDDFYKHSQMADGHLNKCKECNKSDVQRNYRARKEQYREYDRSRQQRPERRAAKLIYGKMRKQRFPHKAKANEMVSNAIRDGRLIRQPCEVCGERKSQAHHDDYFKPLDVRWLCFVHHREVHGQEAVPLVQKKAA